MEKQEFVETRRKRYLAQLMEEFEDKVEIPLDLDPSNPEDRELIEGIRSFKASARRKMQALATDALDMLSAGDVHLNGHAVAVTDRLHPEGRP